MQLMLLVVPPDPKFKTKRIKKLTVAAVNEVLKGKQMLLNAFQCRLFPSRSTNVDNHDYDNDEPEGTLTPESPPTILDPSF